MGFTQPAGHPDCWCALTAPFHPYHDADTRDNAPEVNRSAVCFLLHFPDPRGRWALPTTVSCGARTFLRMSDIQRTPVPLPVPRIIPTELPEFIEKRVYRVGSRRMLAPHQVPCGDSRFRAFPGTRHFQIFPGFGREFSCLSPPHLSPPCHNSSVSARRKLPLMPDLKDPFDLPA